MTAVISIGKGVMYLNELFEGQFLLYTLLVNCYNRILNFIMIIKFVN